MTALLLMAFLGLMAVQAVGTAVFLVRHLRTPWRQTPVSRHLAAYSGALLGLYLVTFLSFFVPGLPMAFVVLGCHVLFAAVIWQRVVLQHRGQHRDR